MHFAIYVYDTHPALQEPRGVSLCPEARSLGEELTDTWLEVTCPRCKEIADRLQLPF
jgi:hypothetical protein